MLDWILYKNKYGKSDFIAAHNPKTMIAVQNKNNNKKNKKNKK